MVRITPSGKANPSFQMISFQPPQTYLAFHTDGWIVTGESAPGFPSYIKRYFFDGHSETVTDKIPWASGVAVAEDGMIFTSSTSAGEIWRIDPRSKEEMVFIKNLKFPQALAVSQDGALYAVTSSHYKGNDVFSLPAMGDTLQAFSADGKELFSKPVPNAAQISLNPDGWLYIAARDKLVRIDAQGNMEIFASGFKSARGVASGTDGAIYVADESENTVIKISGYSEK